MPSVVISGLHRLPLIFIKPQQSGTVLPSSQSRTLNVVEVKWFAQIHMFRKLDSDAKVYAFSFEPCWKEKGDIHAASSADTGLPMSEP